MPQCIREYISINFLKFSLRILHLAAARITEYYGTRSFSFVIFRTDALQNTCIDTLAVFALLFVNKCAALSVLRASFSLLLPRSSPSQND